MEKYKKLIGINKNSGSISKGQMWIIDRLLLKNSGSVGNGEIHNTNGYKSKFW